MHWDPHGSQGHLGRGLPQQGPQEGSTASVTRASSSWGPGHPWEAPVGAPASVEGRDGSKQWGEVSPGQGAPLRASGLQGWSV